MIPSGASLPYLPRVIDSLLADRLRSAGAVLVEGPKACGKTSTAEVPARSAVYLDVDRNALTALQVDPGLVLNGDAPQLVDEWQLEADIVWGYVRYEVNQRAGSGHFILTGSAVPADNLRRHSGAGRFARLTMRPMSLFESGDSSGAMSLAALLAGERPTSVDNGLTVPRIAELISRGGWPANLHRTIEDAQRANAEYVTLTCEVDVARLEGVRRDPAKVRRLLVALARATATETPILKLAKESEPAGEPAGDLARSTVYDYLEALRRLILIEDQPAWATHLRSKAVLRTADKRHLIDPSLAVAALGSSATALLEDLEFMGLLFESMVIRDLRIFADPLDAHVSHYRDSDGLEVDAIVHTTSGAWGAFEVKLGTAQIDAAAQRLLTFAEKVDTSRAGTPTVLAVITGFGYGYVRPDGVIVVPISALGP
jgi:predicted AAA+ superfamily ATPase